MKKSTLLILLVCLPLMSLFSKEAWDTFKSETISKMTTIEGWCNEEKAVKMMDLIKKYRCKRCVEIGVYSGKSLFPIAKALNYQEKGVVFAIDAWNASEATKGFNAKQPDFDWWSKVNYKRKLQDTEQLIAAHRLGSQCQILQQSSKEALELFEDNSIDFIHFDGNHNEAILFEDVSSYFTKIKHNGIIVLNDPNWMSSKLALVFLLERTEILSSFIPSATYYVFKKNNKRIVEANDLFNH